MTELQTNWPHYVIGIVVYPGMTTLDVVGPQTVFAGLPNVEIHRAWKTLAPVTGDDGMVILPDTTFADCPPLDVICIGGGFRANASKLKKRDDRYRVKGQCARNRDETPVPKQYCRAF